MAARYRRDISIVIVEIRNQPAADENALADLQAAGTQTMRDCDYAAAYGDRGFLFLLPETPPNGAEVFAGRLRRAVSDNFPAILCGITGWSPSTVATGILSLASTVRPRR